MKPGLPWSIKGVDPELREAAKEAAGESGMTLGAWLNQVIAQHREGGAPPAAGPTGPTGDAAALARLEDRLAAIEGGVARLAAVPAASAAPAARPEDIDLVVGRIDAVAERLASLETTTARLHASPAPAGEEPAGGAFAERFAAMEQRVDRIEKGVARALAMLDRGFRGLDGRLAAPGTGSGGDDIDRRHQHFRQRGSRRNDRRRPVRYHDYNGRSGRRHPPQRRQRRRIRRPDDQPDHQQRGSRQRDAVCGRCQFAERQPQHQRQHYGQRWRRPDRQLRRR